MIELPIELDKTRPLKCVPKCPYSKCGHCEYVGTDVRLGEECPACSTHLDGCMGWPNAELKELWRDEVFCWNNEKAELATVAAAFYFEASVFDLLHWGTSWFDPQLKLIGAARNEVGTKQDKIWRFLVGVRSLRRANKVLKKLFNADLETMLQNVLGNDFDPFWQNYHNCRTWRNEIAHRGRRIYFEGVPDAEQDQAPVEREQMLWASLKFIPTCWVVFLRVWNEYVHKPLLAKRRQGQK